MLASTRCGNHLQLCYRTRTCRSLMYVSSTSELRKFDLQCSNNTFNRRNPICRLRSQTPGDSQCSLGSLFLKKYSCASIHQMWEAPSAVSSNPSMSEPHTSSRTELRNFEFTKTLLLWSNSCHRLQSVHRILFTHPTTEAGSRHHIICKLSVGCC